MLWDISKQFHQILTQTFIAQCILHRSTFGGSLEVFVHSALLMGHVFSTSLAGLCMIQTGKLFDQLMDKARKKELDYEGVYPPLAKAMQLGALLDPENVPKDFSLQEPLAKSLYADNVIVCEKWLLDAHHQSCSNNVSSKLIFFQSLRYILQSNSRRW